MIKNILLWIFLIHKDHCKYFWLTVVVGDTVGQQREDLPPKDEKEEAEIDEEQEEEEVEEKEKLNHIQTDFNSCKPETKEGNPIQHTNDQEREICTLNDNEQRHHNHKKNEMEITTNFPSLEQKVSKVDDIMTDEDCRCGSIQGKDDKTKDSTSKHNNNTTKQLQQKQHKLHRNHAKHLSNRQRKELAKQERKKRREETKKDPSSASASNLLDNEESSSPSVPQDIRVISI